MTAKHFERGFAAIVRRELLRFLRQRERLLATFIRPLLWLAIFAAGFRAALGLSIIPPYQTYILYEVYIVPGLAAMMLLFNGVQTSLAMAYDREIGTMRLLLSCPLPRWFVLAARLAAAQLVILPAVLAFLLLARGWQVRPPAFGYVAVVPAIFLGGVMLGSIGLLLSVFSRQLENFAAAMNFVIFPMFFASTALYPLWRLEDSSQLLAFIAAANPFTHVVELIRFSLYLQVNGTAFFIVAATALASFGAALLAYDPSLVFRSGLKQDQGSGT
jgi:ABC-2 type transport system permease protein